VINGETTRLRAPRPDDDALLATVRNDVQAQLLMLARPRPNGPDRVREWVQRIAGGSVSMFFVIADAETDAAVGYVQVTEMDLVSGHGRLGIAVDADQRGRGYGREAVVLVGGHVRTVFGLRKLVLDVRADNKAAVDLYRSLGFREVGVLEAHFRVGDAYHDVLVMEQALVS
jgi:RimJ/RimL family protein N-acetyltransferase